VIPRRGSLLLEGTASSSWVMVLICGGVACLASWEVVQSPVITMLLISPVLSGSQGDCRRD
jgi:hypothetical protein